MLGGGTDSEILTWSVPECPFTVACSARTLDDIRLVITDAFFSLARGGLEIGGILLGGFDGKRLSVLEYAQLECEHAYGPSFTVSPNDRARLRQLLGSVPEDHPGLQVVGWYHSHTRSGIHLSEEDLDLYHRYFPESWQVAMVMKPHTFDPARIGFFFRGADGTVYAKESYKELTLEPLPIRQIPTEAPPRTKLRPSEAHRDQEALRDRSRRKWNQVELEFTAETVAPEPIAPLSAPPAAPPQAPAPPPPPVAVRPTLSVERAPDPVPDPEKTVEYRGPSFPTAQKPSGSGRLMVWAVLGAAATLAVIFGAVRTREMWMPKFVSAMHLPAQEAPLPPPSMGLRMSDKDGQLEIDWDRYSTRVREGASARLEIYDGGPSPRTILLDQAHLQTGAFTYGRQSDKVDVKLIVRGPDGTEVSEVTTYVGKLPERKPSPEEEAAKKQRDELAAQTAKMKADLNSQAARTRKLERQLEELRRQQQKRMQNQVEGK
jgi:proteasome lid subunit RPN8/RPN11